MQGMNDLVALLKEALLRQRSPSGLLALPLWHVNALLEEIFVPEFGHALFVLSLLFVAFVLVERRLLLLFAHTVTFLA